MVGVYNDIMSKVKIRPSKVVYDVGYAGCREMVGEIIESLGGCNISTEGLDSALRVEKYAV